jgi:farnesyl diphosphate synthase
MTDPLQQVSRWQKEFEKHLESKLSHLPGAPRVLNEAMRYSSLAGGKRMRPLLVYASGRALGLESTQLHGIATAIELIHTYSLIHDDLPSMDDDDLRRGMPTCHRAFSEATAILAGDALQALAFEVLASDDALGQSPSAQAQIIRSIAHACGAAGMAGGQILDLAAIDQEINLEQLETMHRLKTGALICVSATSPALLSGAEQSLRQNLARFGDSVGLAFQIHDDVLDVTASSQETGKPSQADAARNKPAFPSVIGLEASQRRASELCQRARDSLQGFPGDVSVLQWLAQYAIQRSS